MERIKEKHGEDEYDSAKMLMAMRVKGDAATTYYSVMLAHAATPTLLALEASAAVMPTIAAAYAPCAPTLHQPSHASSLQKTELWFKSLHFMIPKGVHNHPHPPPQPSPASSFPQKKQDRWFQITSLHHDSLAPPLRF
jgi:hypothetical protein